MAVAYSGLSQADSRLAQEGRATARNCQGETAWKQCFKKYGQFIKDVISFIQGNKHPNLKLEENRGLLNWWKYNKKLAKLDKLSEEKLRMLQELSDW